MNIVFQYILCYGTAFCFGMLTMCFVLYFLNQRRLHKREILRKRKNQLQRDMRRGKSWHP